MDAAAGQTPQQKAIDRAERELAVLRRSARALDVIEHPRDFRGGEIRVEHEPGLVRDLRLMVLRGKLGAHVGRAAILPDDRVVDRLAGGTVPDQRGLALVGDADRRDVFRRDAGFRHHFAHGLDRGRPDRLRIVLDQAGRRIDLRKFPLRDGDGEAGAIERDGARRGRALVDGDHVGRQAHPLFGGGLGFARIRHEALQRLARFRAEPQPQLRAAP